jgi:uncharacterized Tic20 family protein
MSRSKLAKNENNYRKNSATFTHLSALTQYFIPFGILFFQYYFGLQKTSLNLLITVENKSSISISLLLYTIGLALIAIPVLF